MDAARRHDRPYLAAMADPLASSRDDTIEFGLLAARAAATMRRIMADEEIDATDRAVLTSLRDGFAEAAQAIRFASTSGTAGREPTRLAAVGLTIEALTDVGREPVDQEAAAAAVESFAELLGDVLETEDQERAEDLLPVLQALASAATQAAGSSGDVLLTSL